MSVQSEITRLENAKAAIKAAIEGKGVTVPEATLLDGMAALIESIEAGGGVKIASGTIVLSEPSSKVEFTHNFGEGANFLTIFTSESSVNSEPGLFLLITSRRRAVIARNNSSGSKTVNINVGENSGSSSTSDVTSIIGNKPMYERAYNIYSDDTKIYINGFMEEGLSHRLKDGVEYIWLASTWSDD